MKRRKGKSVIFFVSFLSFFLGLFFSVHVEAFEFEYELDFESATQLKLSFDSMIYYNTTYTISARRSGEVITGFSSDYKISATLLYMKLADGRILGRNRVRSSDDMPKLQVSNTVTSRPWSYNYFNYTENTLTATTHVSGGSYINITQEGIWSPGDEATVLFTIYYEAAACNWCSSSQAFCCSDCGGKGCNAESNKFDVRYWNDGKTRVFEFKEIQGSSRQVPYRCIPSSLKCNGMPNCGVPYVGDESDCTEEPCIYYECYWDMSYVWTALLAIVFFVISPTVVVFLICYHRQLTVLSRRRGIRRESDSSITVNSPPNDLPPTYDEITRGMEEPPPCFCRATSMISSSVDSPNGIDNPSFLSEDSMTVQKSGSIAVSPASAVVCSCNKDNDMTSYNMPIIATTPAVSAPNAGLTNITSSTANNSSSGDNDDKIGSQTQSRSQRNQPRNAHKRQNQRQYQESNDNNLESHTQNMPNNIDSNV